jgi:asparaginyl-tRNA synthetase
MALGKVYCFGPTFRAERSKTRRHLTEFWMVEPEWAYADLDDVMAVAETLVSSIVARVLEERQPELEILERDPAPLEHVVPPFPRLTYDEAVPIILEEHPDFEVGGDLGAPHETTLSSRFDRPVLLHRWPKATKAFYMAPDPRDPERVLGVDMLATEGHGEIIGGGQRAESLEYLEQQIEAHGLPRESFEWFLDLRRYGSVPHGGFGLGLERTVGWLCGLEHIREAIPFPRTIYRITP